MQGHAPAMKIDWKGFRTGIVIRRENFKVAET